VSPFKFDYGDTFVFIRISDKHFSLLVVKTISCRFIRFFVDS